MRVRRAAEDRERPRQPGRGSRRALARTSAGIATQDERACRSRPEARRLDGEDREHRGDRRPGRQAQPRQRVGLPQPVRRDPGEEGEADAAEAAPRVRLAVADVDRAETRSGDDQQRRARRHDERQPRGVEPGRDRREDEIAREFEERATTPGRRAGTGGWSGSRRRRSSARTAPRGRRRAATAAAGGNGRASRARGRAPA